MERIFVVFIIFLGFFLSINAQDISTKDSKLGYKLDSALMKQFKPNEPGCAVLVTNKGQIIYKKAFGMANLELNVPMNPDMVFAIASITKQFTGVAIMQLVEKGKIRLQDSINKYIPDYPTHGYYISIEYLLTHTSGIKNFQSIKDFDSIVSRLDYKPMDFINLFKNENMDFAPGTKWNYSNSGYFLLGYIIEIVSGMPYSQYIEENILKPAGMTNSYYNDYKKIIKDRVNGYRKVDNGFSNPLYLSPSILYSAGALLSTVEDMFKYYQALNSYKLISKESLEKTRTSYKLVNGTETGYGYGIGVQDIYGYSAVSHTGGGAGFSTLQVYFRQKDVNFIIFTNCSSYSDYFQQFYKLSIIALENCK
jgi:CubicO group peptidase (beta-lactamase class C family)